MGEYNRSGIYMVGGVVLGMLAATIIGQHRSRLRPALAGLISRGLDAKDQAAIAVETFKEQTDDLFAEAEAIRQERRGETPGVVTQAKQASEPQQ